MTVYLRAYVNGQGTERNVADVFQFPGGETHLKIKTDLGGPEVTFIADVRGARSDDLIAALMWADVAAHRRSRFSLFLPYVPAARADRGEPFGARVYADLINNCAYAFEVIAIDPHSWVTTNLYRNLTALSSVPLIDRALNEGGSYRYDAIIAPDAGAEPRAREAAEHLGLDLYVAEKHRDFDSGIILDYKVPTLPRSGRYLVVDDICDGGGTFNSLASKLGLSKEQLALFVTHGIFSGSATNLRTYYDRIYTTDSHPGHNRVGVATTIVPTYVYMHQNLKGIK